MVKLSGTAKSNFVMRTIIVIFCTLIALIFILLYKTEASQNTNVMVTSTRIIINGSQAYEKVMFINDMSYLPIRTLSEMLGFKSEWDEATGTIILTSESSGSVDKSHINEEDLSGIWVGKYAASQGETGVSISFMKTNDGVETAEFEMFPLATNPQVPIGRFRMDVLYNKETKEIEMKGGEWLKRPDNYDVIDLIGIVDENFIRGVVTYKSKVVGRFNVSRKSG